MTVGAGEQDDGAYGMRTGWGGRVAGTLLAGVLLGPATGRAQDDGAGAFAGGEMVRGTVAAVGADRLDVKTETGEVYKVVVTANTRMMKARQPIKLAEIHPGDGMGAMGVMDAPNRTVHAAIVFVVDAEQLRKAAADLGKTYITGRLAAIDDLKLTIKRPDGVSQVIRVDEDTSFRRRRRGVNGMMGAEAEGQSGGQGAGNGGGGGAASESITLADVKVGDMVYGKGGLKGGVFVPTELGVMDAAAMGRGRRRGGANGAAGPAGGVGGGATGTGAVGAAPVSGGGSPQ